MPAQRDPAARRRPTDLAGSRPVSAEQEAELAAARRRLRRNGIVIILVLDVLVLGVGIAGSADLRSMRTPQGTAAAWADAAATGDCDRYLDLETPRRRNLELAGVAASARVSSVSTHKPVSQHSQLCMEVANAWFGFTSTRAAVVSRSGDNDAAVTLTAASGIPRADGTLPAPVTGQLRLVRTDGRWHVDTAAPPCPALALTPALALCRAAR